MTRINVVPVEELSDAWLIAEYRELPRVLNGNFSIKDAPNRYKLGTGHVKLDRKLPYLFWIDTIALYKK